MDSRCSETAAKNGNSDINTLINLEAKAKIVHEKARQVFDKPGLSSMLKNEYKNKTAQYSSMYDSIETMKSISDKEETIANLINQQIEILNVRIKWELDWATRAINALDTWQ